MSDQKEKLLASTLEQIEKQFGKEAIMLLGKKNQQFINTFSSGSLVINELLGINGYPRGRVIEIFGPESSGKTTIALHAIAEIQKLGHLAAFIDAEHSIDPNYAQKLGVDTDNLILSQPDSGEQALEIVDTLVKTGAIGLIVIDSVAALTPEVELNGEMREQTIGAQARLMSKALRKITASLNKNQTTVIFINQIREKVGVLFGNPEVTPGGRALKFFSSIRIDVRRSANIGTGNDISGNQVKIKVVKNKLAAPFKTGVTEIIFSKGISQVAELISLAEASGILIRKGSWYQYKEKNLAQGKTNLRLELEKNSKLFTEILDKYHELKNK